jgi:hypothetical protein
MARLARHAIRRYRQEVRWQNTGGHRICFNGSGPVAQAFPRATFTQHGLVLTRNGACSSRRWMGCVRRHNRGVFQPPQHKGVARRKPLALAVGASFDYKRLYAQILHGSWDRLRRQFSSAALSRYDGVHGFPQEVISEAAYIRHSSQNLQSIRRIFCSFHLPRICRSSSSCVESLVKRLVIPFQVRRL